MEDQARDDFADRARLLHYVIAQEAVAPVNCEAPLVRLPSRPRQNHGIRIQPDNVDVWCALFQENCQRPGSAADIEYAVAGRRRDLRNEASAPYALSCEKGDGEIVERRQAVITERRREFCINRHIE